MFPRRTFERYAVRMSADRRHRDPYRTSTHNDAQAGAGRSTIRSHGTSCRSETSGGEATAGFSSHGYSPAR